MAQKFVAKFFPPAKTARLRHEITSFIQFESESLYDSWERFKDLLRKCPHHGLPEWLPIQTFYNGLAGSTRSSIDAASGGAFMAKHHTAGYELVETMAANNYQWPNDRQAPRKVAGVYEVDSFTSLAAQVAALTRRLDN